MEYTAPQHGVSVSAYMQNAEGEVLLLRTHFPTLKGAVS